MLTTVFYPLSHEFLLEHNGRAIDHYWANWDLCNIAVIQATGILSDNASMYDEAVDYYKNEDVEFGTPRIYIFLHSLPGKALCVQSFFRLDLLKKRRPSTVGFGVRVLRAPGIT
jgi:hypothetical protein